MFFEDMKIRRLIFFLVVVFGTSNIGLCGYLEEAYPNWSFYEGTPGYSEPVPMASPDGECDMEYWFYLRKQISVDDPAEEEKYHYYF